MDNMAATTAAAPATKSARTGHQQDERTAAEVGGLAMRGWAAADAHCAGIELRAMHQGRHQVPGGQNDVCISVGRSIALGAVTSYM
jgi:hypothetical protein